MKSACRGATNCRGCGKDSKLRKKFPFSEKARCQLTTNDEGLARRKRYRTPNRRLRSVQRTSRDQRMGYENLYSSCRRCCYYNGANRSDSARRKRNASKPTSWRRSMRGTSGTRSMGDCGRRLSGRTDGKMRRKPKRPEKSQKGHKGREGYLISAGM